MNIFADIIFKSMRTEITITNANAVACCAFVVPLLLAVYALTAWLLGKVFKKAGVPAWKAWVPVYNEWKLLQIGGQQGWVVLLPFMICGLMAVAYGAAQLDTTYLLSVLAVTAILLLAVLYTVKYFLAVWNVNKKLNKRWYWLLLLFVNLGPSVWLWVNALDSSKWHEKYGAKSLAPEMKKKVSKKRKK